MALPKPGFLLPDSSLEKLILSLNEWDNIVSRTRNTKYKNAIFLWLGNYFSVKCQQWVLTVFFSRLKKYTNRFYNSKFRLKKNTCYYTEILTCKVDLHIQYIIIFLPFWWTFSNVVYYIIEKFLNKIIYNFRRKALLPVWPKYLYFVDFWNWPRPKSWFHSNLEISIKICMNFVEIIKKWICLPILKPNHQPSIFKRPKMVCIQPF